MKLLKLVTILISVIILSSCLNRRNLSSESGVNEYTTDGDSASETLSAEDREYIDSWMRNFSLSSWKSNSEMTEYGYDKNGLLVLPLSKLKHCDDAPRKNFAQWTPYPLSVYFDEESAFYDDYNKKLHIVGYVTDLTSYAMRKTTVHTPREGFDLPEIRYASFSGYTETKIFITDVIDVGRIAPDSTNNYDYLIGKEITVSQKGFWAYDDDGNMFKDSTYGITYSYVLKPNVPAVIELCFFDGKASFSDYSTGEEIYNAINKNVDVTNISVSDFYPAEDKNGNLIDTTEKLKNYYAELDSEYKGYYLPWRKNEIKEDLSL